MSRPSASPSLAARFSALLSRDSSASATPESSPAKQRSSAASSQEHGGARSPPKSLEQTASASSSSSAPSPAAAASPSAHSSSSSSSSSNASPGFFGSLKLKASEALAAHRSESAAKELAKKAGLHRVNQRLFLLHFPTDSASSSSASSISAEADQQFKHLDSFLQTYHPGTHLVLDIGGVLAAHGCPDDLFPAARLGLEFNVPSGSDSIGPIDAAARVAQAAARWYQADGGEGSSANVVVLACDPLRALQLLAAVVLYSTEDQFDEILGGAMHAVLLLDSNRFSAQLALRSLPVSSRRFLSDFALLRSFDPALPARPPPRVWIHSLVIHALPQVEEEGTRLLVVLIANRREFAYSSQQQGGGHRWIPTNDSSPLTVSIPIAAAFQGEATLKVWHLPEQSSTRNPRVLIVETKLHSAVLDLPCWRTKNKEEERIDGCILAVNAPASASAATTAAASADSSAASAAASSDAPLPYPLHRMFLRKDDLELGGSASADSNAAGMGPSFLRSDSDSILPPEIEYSKRFGITIVATPLEEPRYAAATAVTKEKGGTPAKDAATAGRERSASAAAASNSINRSQATSPQPIPIPASTAPIPIAHPVSQLSSSSASPVLNPGTPETDLLALSAAYNLPPAAESASSSAAAEEAALEFNPTPLPSAMMSPATPPRKASAAAASSSASTSSSSSSSPAPSAASSSSSSSSAVVAPAASSWVAPVIPVPPLARSTAGLRFWHEDKHGRERPETAAEQAERARLAAERVALDTAYGRGRWRRDGGILHVQAQSGPRNPGMFDPANLSLEAILRAQGSVAQEHAQARALHAAGLGPAPPASYASQQEAEAAMHAQLISQHQQQQQQQHEAHQRQRQRAAAAAAAAAAPQGPSPEQIYSDPNSTAEQKDEAYARILQAQFNEEDEQLQHRAPHPRSSGSNRSSRHRSSHRSSRPAASALAGAPGEVAPPNSASGVDGAGPGGADGPRMVRAGSEPGAPAGSGGAASSSAPAAGSPLDAALQGPSSMQIVAAASIPSAAASASPSSSAASPSPSASPPLVEILPPEFMQLASDMELARSLQSQFDSEASSRSVAALSQAQHGLDPDRLHYDQLLSLSAVIGPAPHARRGGASADEIAALPEFAVTIESKYLEEECQVCREAFVAGETLRQLQCIHAYHKDCIDPWLRQNRTCPVCKVPVHHAR